MSTYAEKAAAYGGAAAFGVPSYDNAEYYRQQPAAAYVATNTFPQQHVAYTAQAYAAPTSYIQPGQQQATHVYGYTQVQQPDNRDLTFNPGAPPPNYSRPPPQQVGKREETYPGSGLSVLEASSAQSSAAYTATWVSRTSTVAPDIQEKREGATSAVGGMDSFGQWNNPEQSMQENQQAAYAQATNQAIDQFNKMNVSEKSYDMTSNAWGATGQDQAQQQQQHQQQQQPQNAQLASQHWPNLTAANDKSDRDKKREERERRQREEPRELTWEERLRKAQGAKDRAENPKFERSPTDRPEPADVRGGRMGGVGGSRGMRGGPRGSGRGMRDNGDNGENGGQMQHQRGDMQGRYNGPRRYPNGMHDGDMGQGMHLGGPHDFRGPYRGRGGIMMPRGAMMPQMPPGPPVHPMMFRGGPPPCQPMMNPPPFMTPGAPIPPMIPRPAIQDSKFKNSWLDAEMCVPCFPPVPFTQVPLPHMLPGALRPMRGRGGYRLNTSGRGRGGKKAAEDRGASAEKDETKAASEDEEHAEGEEHEDVSHGSDVEHKEVEEEEHKVAPEEVTEKVEEKVSSTESSKDATPEKEAE